MNLPITKNGSQISSFNVPDDLTIVSELMGAKEINASLELPGVLTAPIGSQINYKGGVYTINTIPGPQKINNYRYKYDLRFESKEYRLYDKGLKHPTTKNKAFQYYGDLTDYAQLIVSNINQIDSGWTVGICDVLPSKPINFTGQTCRAALDMIAEAFSVEWEVDGQQIRFVKQVGNVTTLIFQYGRGKGLYTLGYKYQEDKNIVTRATGYGSTRNLPENYRNGATQLMFDGEHLDKNIFLADGVTQLYGIKEGDFEDQDIFPEIAGVVSGVSAYDSESNRFTITDSSLTFNLNDYWSTMDAKLSFKSGELQGQEFKITKYDNATKTITLEVFQDGQGNNLPNATFQASIGDTYTLFDMHLPTEIVKAAEDRLQAATQVWLNENCVPRVLYSLEMDPLYARDNGIYLKPGDKVRIIDVDLGIDEFIRVTKTEYNLNFPEVITQNTKISCEIANFIPYTITERVISNTIDNKKDIKVVDKTSSEKARINSLNMKTLSGRIFDPDGNLAKGAETLFAGMMITGFDSQNFGLIDITISTKPEGDANRLIISGGKLVHRMYAIEGLGFDWAMSPADYTSLNPAKFYYVYAKCSKTALAGTWEISETPVFVNDYPGYWVFNLGQLYEVNVDGYRDFAFTNGKTYTVGNTITSGRLQDITKQNYLDVETGQFNLGDALSGMDWGVTATGQLTIRGQVIATDAEFVNLMVSNLKTHLTGRRLEITEADNRLSFFGETGSPATAYEGLRIADNIDSQAVSGATLAGIRANNPAATRTSYLSANGVFSNGSGTQFLAGSSGLSTNGSVVGLLFDRNSDVNGISAGVFGSDQTSTGNSASYAGYFLGGIGLIGSQYVNVSIAGAGYTISGDDYLLICQSSVAGDITINEPTLGLRNGRILKVKNNRGAGSGVLVTLSGTLYTVTSGGMFEFVYIGGTWFLLKS